MNDQDRFTRVTPSPAAPGPDAPGADGAPAIPVFTEWHRREFENSPWAMRIFEHGTFRFLAVNDAAVKLYGYSREEFLAMTAMDTRHPEEHAEFLTTLNEPTGYLRHRGPRRHIKKNGEFIVVEAITQDILFEGRMARLSMNLDITGRLKMQELLRQRQQEFESLAENLPDLVARFDPDYRYLYANSAIEKTTGIDRAQIIGKTQRELGLPEDIAALFEESLAGVFATGQPHTVEFRMALPSGERQYEAYHVPEAGDGGKINSVLCVARDITERKRTEGELTRQKHILDAIIDNLPVGIFIRDAKTHRYVIRNRFVADRFGQRKQDSIGKTIHDIYPREQADQYLASDRRLFETGRMEEIPEREIVDFRTGASRIQHVRKVPLYDEKGQPWLVLGVADDITGRKQAELEMLRSAALSRLLESLARAANEAVTPEAAMVACLERICRYGRWMLGRVELFERGRPENMPGRSIWYAPERERFAEFIRFSNDRVHNVSGPFIGRLLRERTAVWLDDLQQKPGFGRWEAAIRHGLRSAFAFPIIAGGEIVAIMEVFSEEARPQDPHIMGAAHALASQLARIVEREWAHQANARMAAIVESSRDAVVSRTLDGTILTWNPAAERLFGYTAAEIVGRKIEILYPPEIKSEMYRRQELLLQGLPVQAYETVRVAKDGRRVHVSTSPALIRDSSGNICGVSTIVRDNTERMRAGQALRESEERFRQLAENIDRVFWINTPAVDNNLYVSPAYEKIWGKSRESLRRQPNSWKESIHPEDQLRAQEAVARLAAEGVHMDVEYRIICPDGTIRWIRDRSYPMKAGDGTSLVCGIAEDITVRKQAEQERLTHAIRQRDALVREVHHRIKNNLQGVVGLLRQKIRKNPAISQDIEETISQLQSVALVYGLQETRPDGLLNLAEITDAICSSAGNLIGGRLERKFERQSQGPACVVAREAVSVAVALNELVINALKHQPARAGKKHVRVVLRETGDEAEIRIANRGQLPAGFDYHGGRTAGNGLELVRTLLAAPGGTLTFNGARGEVEVVLKLSPPLLAGRQRPLQGNR